jgi:ribonuclease HI
LESGKRFSVHYLSKLLRKYGKSQALIESGTLYEVIQGPGISKRKANLDLWSLFNPLLKKHNVKFYWVKGQASSKWNNQCDELAGEAVMRVLKAG